MVWWCALALAADLEWASPAQPAPVHLEAPAFSGPLVDSGWWPSANDPLAVRFYIEPNGVVIADGDADSELAWPDPLWQRLIPIPDSSVFTVDAGVDMAAQVQIDIGIYTGVIDVWSDEVSLRGEALFDGLLLRGHPTKRVELVIDDDNLVNPVEYGFSIITGVELVFALEAYPRLEAGLEAGQVDGAFVQGTTFQEDDGEWGSLPVDGTSRVEGDLTWSAMLDGSLDVVFEPTLILDTWIGDWDLLSLPLPISVVTLGGRQFADPMAVVHPLPLLDAMPTGISFGTVDVGDDPVRQVGLPNLGELLLEGTARIEGDAAFTVFPDGIAAPVSATDGLVVTFSPTAPTSFLGELVIVTNDPNAPEVRIPLSGTGLALDPEPATTPPGTDGPPDTSNADRGGNREEVEAKGCGCASTGSPWGLGGMVGLVLAMVARRRG